MKRKILLFLLLAILIVTTIISYFFLRKDYRDIVQAWNDNTYNKEYLFEVGLELIKTNRTLIIQAANKYNISPESIAGIILSEHVLNNKPANYFEDYYVHLVLLKKTETELIELRKNTLESLRNTKSDKEILFRLKNGLLLSLGICQISTLKAIELEEELHSLELRNKRTTKEIIRSLLDNKENINYCAFELLNIQQIYSSVANVDIRDKPEILVTLYSTGDTNEKALKYMEKKNKIPKTNKMGKFVSMHIEMIKKTLE